MISTIKRLFAVCLIGVFGVTLFGATNYYNNPLTNAEIPIDNSIKTNSNFVSGSIEKSGLFNSLVDKELSIVIAIISMIEDKGIVPTTINQLKIGSYLPSSFNEENLISNPSKNISFNVVDNVIEINTNINISEVTISEKDYYLSNTYDDNNNFNIDKRQIINSSNILQSNYYINRKSVNILGTKSTNNINHTTRFIGNQEPSSYSTVSNSNVWFDSNVKEFDVKQRINNKWSDTTTSNKNLKEDGTFISPRTLPITAIIKNFENVTVTEETKVIICRTSGATYNQVLNRCEAFTSDACDGNFYDLATDKCYKKPIDYCTAMGYDGYDGANNRCSKTTYVPLIIKKDCPLGTSISNITGLCMDNGHSSTYISNAISYCSSKGLRLPSPSEAMYLPNYNGNAIWTNYTWYKIGGGCEKYPRTDWYDSYNGKTKVSNLWLRWCNGVHDVRPSQAYRCVENEKISYTCPLGFGATGLSGTSACKKIEYLTIPTSYGTEYNFSNNGIGGVDAYVKTPSCNGKNMSVSPYTSTPHYGNNGICYSDTGLYCKTYAGSTSIIQMPDGKQITCWDNSQTCDDTKFNLTYNYSGIADKCNKYNYTCNAKSRYGLSEHPTLNNPTDLFNRITSKDDKVLPYLTAIINKQNILVNDNDGSMCVDNIKSNYNSVPKDYLIDNKTKSGF